MRKLVAGVDPVGRSCIVEETPLEPDANSAGQSGIKAAFLSATTSAPPPPRPPGNGRAVDLGVAPGMVQWVIVEWDADAAASMHHTDTIDYDLILDGSVELGLDDGPHPLEAGDVVIVQGVDHSWTVGPKGCRMSVLSLGTPPPA